ncbi:MAG: hypothetical protein MUE81_21810 [Thermoflexibacter sp.]|nr:hypothetical protein [Thermoflexibacter sp.]
MRLEKLSSSASFIRSKPPDLQDNILAIENNKLKGIWTKQMPNISEILLENEQGYILWECFIPLAYVQLDIRKNVSSYTGNGYVEKLTLSVKPWEMPIKVLHWGRFLTENQSIIWIRWEGEETRNLVFYNGIKQENPQIDEQRIFFGNFCLDLSEKYILRNGSLISTIFRRFAWLKKIFPSKILHLQECKWQSKGVLTQDGQKINENWAIHEKVEWL